MIDIKPADDRWSHYYEVVVETNFTQDLIVGKSNELKKALGNIVQEVIPEDFLQMYGIFCDAAEAIDEDLSIEDFGGNYDDGDYVEKIKFVEVLVDNELDETSYNDLSEYAFEAPEFDDDTIGYNEEEFELDPINDNDEDMLF